MNKNRTLTIAGREYSVPPRIQRIDDQRYTHGWQVRYEGTCLFSDGKEGPAPSFKRAVAELNQRYAEHPPPLAESQVRDLPLSHKQNDLPAGISGPVMRHRQGRAPLPSSRCRCRVATASRTPAPRSTSPPRTPGMRSATTTRSPRRCGCAMRRRPRRGRSRAPATAHFAPGSGDSAQ